MALRDIAARLPLRLDAASWRAPPSDVAELTPGWRRYDRTHLGINLEFPADGHERTWEAWFFFPETFRLTPDFYDAARIGADIQPQVRFSTPTVELRHVPRELRTVTARIRTADPDDMSAELRLFACRVRDSIEKAIFEVRIADDDGALEARASDLADRAEDVLRTVRRRLLPEMDGAHPDVAKAIGWVDEHLSRYFETAMVRLAADLGERESADKVLDRVTRAAVTEARYRADIGAGPMASPESSTHELEQVERRQNALKRLMSGVLLLDSEAHDPRRRVEHILHALAAGIAMSFAVTAALVYGAPTDAADVWVWSALAIIAYMAKDRIKAGLQDAFDRRIEARQPNRNWIVRDRIGSRELATATEKYRLVSRSELPSNVAAFRVAIEADSFGEATDSEHVLHHRKSTTVDGEVVREIDPRFEAITEVLRVDVARWLTHTDDPRRTVTLADPETGELFKSSLPRSYDVTIIHRLGRTGAGTPWSAARVVVSRKGIRRVDRLDD